MIPPAKDSAGQLTQYSQMYLFLATLFRLPTRETVALIQDDSFVGGLVQEFFGSGPEGSVEDRNARCDGLRSAFTDFSDACRALMEEEQTAALRRLRTEYTRLFDHPSMPTVQRFESLFLHFHKHPDIKSLKAAPPQYINPKAMDAERRYKKAGFAASAEINEPCDAISSELEFLHVLCESKLAALEEGAAEKAAFADECMQDFLDSHLALWALPFFLAVSEQSAEKFYKAAGRIGEEFFKGIFS